MPTGFRGRFVVFGEFWMFGVSGVFWVFGVSGVRGWVFVGMRRSWGCDTCST